MKLKCAILAVMALFLVVGVVAAEKTASVTITDSYVPNTYEPDPYIIENVTIANKKNTTTTALDYEDDGGDIVAIPGAVQKIYLKPNRIVSPLGLQKPIASNQTNGTKWLNASAWVGHATYSGNTTFEVVKRYGVDTLHATFTGSASGTLTNFYDLDVGKIEELTKKHFVIGIEVVDGPTCNSTYASMLIVRFDNTVGTTEGYEVQIAPTCWGAETYIPLRGTGTILFAEQYTGLKNSTVVSNIDTINSIRLTFSDAIPDAAESLEFYLFALAVDDKAPSFGKLGDASVIKMPESAEGVMVLDTFKPSFKWQKVTSFGPVTFKMKASELSNRSTTVDYEELSDTQKVDYTKEYAVREYFTFNFTLPEAVDLTYGSSGLLKDVPGINTRQYDYVSTQTGSADPVQKTSIYTGARKGDTVTILSSMAAGAAYVLYYEILLTQAQWEGTSESVGAITSDSSAWWNVLWLSLAGFLGLKIGTKRKRKNG